jgi:integrase
MYKGKWFRKSTGTPNLREAEQIEKKFREEYINEKTGLRKDISLGKALDEFKKSKEGTPNYANVVHHVSILKQGLGSMTNLHDVSTAQITEFVTKLKRKYSNSTIKHRLQTLRSTINLANDYGYIVPDIKYPKLKTTRGRTRVLSAEEIQAIENELHPDKTFGNYYLDKPTKRFRQDAYDMFIILCATGARFTEISTMEWQQVNLQQGTIHLYRSKVDNESVLVLTDKALDVLQRRSRNPISQEYVFPNRRNDGPRGYSGVAIKKAIKRAGLGPDVTPHVIRHTVATRLLEAGLNLVDVQGILGHADLSTTRRYLHTSTQDAARKAAQALNDLNREGTQPKLKVVE